jgi:hypothetical protein
LACDTLLPDCARLPVTWQTLAIVGTSIMNGPPLARAVSAQRMLDIAALTQRAAHYSRIRRLRQVNR